MIKPAQGLSAVPLFLAMAALLAASASFGLIAAQSGRSSHPGSTTAAVRSPVEADAKNDATRYVRVEGPVRTLAPAGDPSGNDVGTSTALCPAGMRAISGGFQTITGGGETFYSDALTSGRVGWAVGAVNKLGTSGTVQAIAYCVPSRRRATVRQRAAAKRRGQALGDRYKTLRGSQL
jgi:hypothetical protein